MSWLLIPQIMFCKKCFKYDCIEAFAKNSASKNGRRHECKDCNNKHAHKNAIPLHRRTIENKFKEAPYRAMARLVKEDPETFIAAASKNRVLYDRLLKEERQKIEALLVIRQEFFAQRLENMRENRARSFEQMS